MNHKYIIEKQGITARFISLDDDEENDLYAELYRDNDDEIFFWLISGRRRVEANAPTIKMAMANFRRVIPAAAQVEFQQDYSI